MRTLTTCNVAPPRAEGSQPSTASSKTDSAPVNNMLLRNGDFQRLLDAMATPVFVKDVAHRFIFLNTAFAALIGLDPAQLLDRDGRGLYVNSELDAFQETDTRVFETGKTVEAEQQLTTANGEVRTIVTTKARVEFEGAPVLVAVIHDVTAYRKAEAYNRFLAYHDTLTGLPNRALLFDHMQRSFKTADSTQSAALLILDLDHFKNVNDTYGHLPGDELIRRFSQQMISAVRAEDVVARLGGDEFAIFIEGVSSREDVRATCERITTLAGEPFKVTGSHASVGASIGAVMVPAGVGFTVGELLRKADLALFAAKADGGDCHRFYEPSMDEGHRQRADLQRQLAFALETGCGLSVEYQPIVSNGYECLTGVEALVRWDHAEYGSLPPLQFIAIAEESGLIFRLGDWVLNQACAAIVRHQDVTLAVNLSAVQLRDPHLADRVFSILSYNGFEASRLELEITETAILTANAVAQRTLRRLRASGVRIALDDFGTGYSSLERLNGLEVDKIKVDRSFTMHLEQSASAGAIVAAVVQIANALNLVTTVEGVETEGQRTRLASIPCTELQGFLFSKPLSQDKLAEFIHAYTPGGSK